MSLARVWICGFLALAVQFESSECYVPRTIYAKEPNENHEASQPASPTSPQLSRLQRSKPINPDLFEDVATKSGPTTATEEQEVEEEKPKLAEEEAKLQEEVGRNIIKLEPSDCSCKLTYEECKRLKDKAKWKYMDRFLGLSSCDGSLDLKVPGLEPGKSTVPCPYHLGARPARVLPLLTNAFLQKMGIVFRVGREIDVPGEGVRPISLEWDNGTKKQRDQRQEIGRNICQWASVQPGWCFFRTKTCLCMYKVAVTYYIITYSPTGRIKDVCNERNSIFDLHLDSMCEITCITELSDGYVDYALTKENVDKVPASCAAV